MLMTTQTGQLSFSLYDQLQPSHANGVAAAIEALASAASDEGRGAVFTRREVVDFILDLAGYTVDAPLHQARILEPSFGGGDFLLAIVERLLEAWQRAGARQSPLEALGNAVRAVELHHKTYAATFDKVLSLLAKADVEPEAAQQLVQRWLLRGDYLLTSLAGDFNFVVGNPPFVRQELIPAALLTEYRVLYPTLYDRADLYVPFIERSLALLAEGGSLAFICADRWMKNRYGGPLRRMVAEGYHLKAYIDMVGTPAFQAEVTAYPAITLIARNPKGPTRIAHRPNVDATTLAALARMLRAESLPAHNGEVRELATVPNGSEPWLLEAPDQLALIRRLEQSLPTLEEVGCKVSIGVATGADKVFIADFESFDIEADRKLPLATTEDIASGEVRWKGKGVLNPFGADGELVRLDDYPRLRRYLEAHRAVIANRHCARKSPARWYRTIDRIDPVIARTPKLLIPDIKGESHVVFEGGQLYPHHNLYYIVAGKWDLRALQAVLLSDVTRLFIATYSTKMRGGFLRFQAQYLRRIRIPAWGDVPHALRVELAQAAIARDVNACNSAVYKLYNMSEDERAALGGNGG